MRTSPGFILFLLLISLTVSGCDFIGDVIEFSLWTILIILIVLALIIFAIFKAFFD